MNRKVKFLIIIIFIIVLTFSGIYTAANLIKSDEENKEDFTFTSLNGNEIHLSNYRGKIVILDLWATWCSPCKSQMKELKEIYNSYTREKLEILSVDVDPSETLEQIQDFILESKNQEGIDLNWIFGKDDGSVWEKYMTKNAGIPTLCIFDQQGNLYFQDAGLKDAEVISQKIDNLL